MVNNPATLLFNLTETATNVIAHAVKSGIVIANTEKTNKRIEICYTCSNLDKSAVRCNLCGCFMQTKVRFDAAVCPDKKW